VQRPRPSRTGTGETRETPARRPCYDMGVVAGAGALTAIRLSLAIAADQLRGARDVWRGVARAFREVAGSLHQARVATDRGQSFRLAGRRGVIGSAAGGAS